MKKKKKKRQTVVLKFQIDPPSFLVHRHEDLFCLGPLIEEEIWSLSCSLGGGLPTAGLRGSS